MTLDFVFNSPDHLRHQNGQHVGGPHGGAPRCVEVVPNTSGCEGYDVQPGDGYIVTVYNLDGPHPLWRNNVQMAPKVMRIHNRTEDSIELRGFRCMAQSPFGWMEFDGSEYGLTISHSGHQVRQCVLHLHDRNVDITYLGST